VFTLGDTEIPLPVPTKVPPQEPEYHVIKAPVPALPPFKVRIVLDPSQIVDTEAVADVGLVDSA
jgi:hypothetical protein